MTASPAPPPITKEEDLIVLDTEDNLKPVVLKIKAALGDRAYKHAKTIKILDETINSCHDLSCLMVALILAAWSMCNVWHANIGCDFFTMLLFCVEIVPWEMTACSRANYNMWVVAIYKSVLGPFDKIPVKCRATTKQGDILMDDSYYCCVLQEYLRRVRIFMCTYTNVSVAPELGERYKNSSTDSIKAWFFTEVLKQYEPYTLGDCFVSLVERYEHVVQLARLERKHLNSRERIRAHDKTTRAMRYAIRPYVHPDDQKLMCVVRSMLCLSAHACLHPFVLGVEARMLARKLRRERIEKAIYEKRQRIAEAVMKERERLANIAFHALLKEEYELEALKRKKAAKKKKAQEKRLLRQMDTRAYTLHPVWELLGKTTGALVMHLEIAFPANDAACNTEDDDQTQVCKLLEMRWCEALRYDRLKEAGLITD